MFVSIVERAFAQKINSKPVVNLNTEERILKLEKASAVADGVTADLAQQIQAFAAGLELQSEAFAKELREQASVNISQEKKLTFCLVLSVTALVIATAAVIVALRR